MQFLRVAKSTGSVVRASILQHVRVGGVRTNIQSQQPFEAGKAESAPLEEHGFESSTIADLLKQKGKADGSWLFCTTDDTVYDAVKSVRSWT